jgi:hypothetical protein
MPVFAEVRVIPQHLEETYAILLEGFKSVPDEGGCRCPD